MIRLATLLWEKLILSRILCYANPRLSDDTYRNKSSSRIFWRPNFFQLPHHPKARVVCVQSQTLSSKVCKSFLKAALLCLKTSRLLILFVEIAAKSSTEISLTSKTRNEETKEHSSSYFEMADAAFYTERGLVIKIHGTLLCIYAESDNLSSRVLSLLSNVYKRKFILKQAWSSFTFCSLSVLSFLSSYSETFIDWWNFIDFFANKTTIEEAFFGVL